jgi:subtilisin-like proprotein convertase family protein
MRRTKSLFFAVLLGLGGCTVQTDDGGGPAAGPGGKADNGGSDRMFPLSDRESVAGGIEGGEAPRGTRRLTRDGHELPASYTKLVQYQSPVSNQQSRGVCSIFSTVGLMEHLYIKASAETEGATDWAEVFRDEQKQFSEQYLQWAVKSPVVGVEAFPDSSGSNARSNLRAIAEHGIPQEQVWPYVGHKLSDAECTGEDKPTFCFTQGDKDGTLPDDIEAKFESDAPKLYTLPGPNWMWPDVEQIKIHMKKKETGVIVGLDFYYQAWNHGGSNLPTSEEYSRKGYVTYPNEADQEFSEKEENRAGHSILLIGWDDTMKVQKRNKEGELLYKSESGELLPKSEVGEDAPKAFEKGFFLFKNSWGTGFGSDMPEDLGGPGFGWISYKYVSEYGRAVSSDLPELEASGSSEATTYEPEDEIEETKIPFTDTPEMPADEDVLSYEIVVPEDEGAIDTLELAVEVSHPYFGADLQFWLRSPEGERIALGGEKFTEQGRKSWMADVSEHSEQLKGAKAAGTWTLEMTDDAYKRDFGYFYGWSLTMTTSDPSSPEDPDADGDNPDSDGDDPDQE